MSGLVAVPLLLLAGVGALAFAGSWASAAAMLGAFGVGPAAARTVALLAGAGLGGAAVGFAPQLARALGPLSEWFDRLRPVWALAAILVAGLALRLAATGSAELPADAHGGADLQIARQVAETGRYLDTHGDVAFRPPGYPLSLSIVGSAFGLKEPLSAVLVVNILAYFATVISAFALAGLLFGRASGLAAAAVVTVWPDLVHGTAAVGRDLLALALLTASLALYVGARRVESRRAAPVALALGCGLAAGALSLVQPAFLALPAVLATGELILFEDLRSSARRLVLIGTGAALAVVPWLMRSEQHLGSLVPVTSGSGVAFYAANNPQAGPGGSPRTPVDLMALPERERSTIGYRLALQWVAAEPHTFLKLCWKRLLGFAGGSAGATDEGRTMPDARPRPADGPVRAFGSVAWLAAWLGVLVAVASGSARSASPPGAWVIMLACLYAAAMAAVAGSGVSGPLSIAGLIAVLAGSILAPPTVTDGRGATAAGRGPLAQFVDFAAVGAVGTAAHFATLIVLVQSFGWPAAGATTAGFLVGAVMNYGLNYRLTFQSTASHATAVPRFLSIAFLTMLLNLAIVWLLVDAGGVHYLLGQAVSTCIVLVVNFVANRVLTFKASRTG